MARPFGPPWLVGAIVLAIWCSTTLIAQGQGRIYFDDFEFGSASMAANGTDKRAETWGKPSYQLHGGQRWFLQLRSLDPGGSAPYEVFAVSQDGAHLVQLSNDPSFSPRDVAWSKNDRIISYTGIRYLSGPLDGVSQILRVNLMEDASGVLAPSSVATVLATAGVTVVSGPYLQQDIFSHDWAPSGAELIYQHAPGYNAGEFKSYLRRVNTITGTDTLLVDGGLEGVYSPNGAEIAFRSGYGSNGQSLMPGIYAIRPNGSGLRVLVKDSQFTASYGPSWAPSGTSLAFTRQTIIKPSYATIWDIFSAPTSGGKAAKVTNLTSDIERGAISPQWR